MYISDDAGRGRLDFLLKSKYERDLGVSQLYATEIRDHLKTGSFLEKGGWVGDLEIVSEKCIYFQQRERERESEWASAQNFECNSFFEKK